MKTHDTVVIGQKDGEVVFLKSYDYKNDPAQAAQAQADLKEVIDAGLDWVIQDATLIFKSYERRKQEQD